MEITQRPKITESKGERYTEPKSKIYKAIRTYCVDCSGGSTTEVKNCPLKNCPLYLYRLGRSGIKKEG
jgi:hypothetical protein